MTARAHELLVVGLAGTALAESERRLLERVRPGGVILFARNVEAPEQLAELVAAVRRAVPGVLLYSDSEGGRVDRLAAVVGGAPSGAQLAAAPPAAARRAGRWVGESLRRFGLDVDLAPVVDLDHGEEGNALDGRYLGSTPRAVAARAGAFLDGLHAAGIGGCVKHFPGLGPSTGDTHFGTGRVEATAAELEPDLEPFRRLAARAGAVLVSHAVYPALDPDERPASLAPPVHALLREEVGFAGVVVSDDLEMHALAPHGDLVDRTETAFAAGCDLLAVCHTLEAAPDIAERLGRPEHAPRVVASARRLDRYRRHLAQLPAGRRYRLETIRKRLARLAGFVKPP